MYCKPMELYAAIMLAMTGCGGIHNLGGSALTDCGNGELDPGEECDPGDGQHVLRSDGSKGLPAGTPYDAWNCDPASCKRRYVYTPCTGVGSDVENCLGGFCDGRVCQPVATEDCKAWGINNPVVECEVDASWRGLCGLDHCLPRCDDDPDCPQNSACATLYPQSSEKVCQPALPATSP